MDNLLEEGDRSARLSLGSPPRMAAPLGASVRPAWERCSPSPGSDDSSVLRQSTLNRNLQRVDGRAHLHRRDERHLTTAGVHHVLRRRAPGGAGRHTLVRLVHFALGVVDARAADSLARAARERVSVVSIHRSAVQVDGPVRSGVSASGSTRPATSATRPAGKTSSRRTLQRARGIARRARRCTVGKPDSCNGRCSGDESYVSDRRSSACRSPGGTVSRWNTRTGGSRSSPVSIPCSQCRHHRTARDLHS